MQLCFCMTSRPHKCLGFLFWGLEWITLSERHEYIEFCELKMKCRQCLYIDVISSSFLEIPFNILPYYFASLHCVIQALLSFAFLWQSHLMIQMYYICFLKPSIDCSPVKMVNIPNTTPNWPKLHLFSFATKVIYFVVTNNHFSINHKKSFSLSFWEQAKHGPFSFYLHPIFKLQEPLSTPTSEGRPGLLLNSGQGTIWPST